MNNLFFTGLGAIMYGMLLTGCADVQYQAYSGARLPHEGVAILQLTSTLALYGPQSVHKVAVIKVDDLPLKAFPGDSIELLPGKHTIRFLPQNQLFSSDSISTYAITGTRPFDAGKTYTARAFVVEQHGLQGIWRVQITEDRPAGVSSNPSTVSKTERAAILRRFEERRPQEGNSTNGP